MVGFDIGAVVRVAGGADAGAALTGARAGFGWSDAMRPSRMVITRPV